MPLRRSSGLRADLPGDLSRHRRDAAADVRRLQRRATRARRPAGSRSSLLIATARLHRQPEARHRPALRRRVHRRRLRPLHEVLILAGSAFALILSFDYLRRRRDPQIRISPCWCCSPRVGMLLIASANNLISLYLSLELQSLALYVLAAFRRDSVLSAEAGLKYFVLGALSSGLLLYGCSLVYGFTGDDRVCRHRQPCSAAPTARSA